MQSNRWERTFLQLEAEVHASYATEPLARQARTLSSLGTLQPDLGGRRLAPRAPLLLTAFRASSLVLSIRERTSYRLTAAEIWASTARTMEPPSTPAVRTSPPARSAMVRLASQRRACCVSEPTGEVTTRRSAAATRAPYPVCKTQRWGSESRGRGPSRWTKAATSECSLESLRPILQMLRSPPVSAFKLVQLACWRGLPAPTRST